mmetsp:Transcript_146786/g.471232  ORF Transcript_146786/g.471232 Transcript_146786/m.471232 type:complete len:228 (-) Transcript_146786:336-1019(-)
MDEPFLERQRSKGVHQGACDGLPIRTGRQFAHVRDLEALDEGHGEDTPPTCLWYRLDAADVQAHAPQTSARLSCTRGLNGEVHLIFASPPPLADQIRGVRCVGVVLRRSLTNPIHRGQIRTYHAGHSAVLHLYADLLSRASHLGAVSLRHAGGSNGPIAEAYEQLLHRPAEVCSDGLPYRPQGGHGQLVLEARELLDPGPRQFASFHRGSLTNFGEEASVPQDVLMR